MEIIISNEIFVQSLNRSIAQSFNRPVTQSFYRKMKLLYTYIIILILLAILPINGTSSMLNNNYLLNIRWDYLVHALVYIPLVPLVMIAYNSWKVKPQGRAAIIILSLLFAFSLEGIQYFIPYRAFNINDLAANGVGVILGLITYTILKKKLVIVF